MVTDSDSSGSSAISRLFESGESIPNNSRLPLVIYPGAVGGCSSEQIAAIFAENRWHGCWVNGVFSYQHYHSTAHEVLGCFSGKARVQFGGEAGETFELAAGDAVVIPAGVGHKNLGSSSDFAVVGAYPNGQSHDMGSLEPASREEMNSNIANVPLPEADPVFGGDDTPLMQWWRPGYDGP